MDFNQTYLLSQKGSAINDSNNSVIIEVVDVINNLSLKDGIEKINGAYYLYLNQIDAKFTSNQFIPQITDQIIAYDDNVELMKKVRLRMTGKEEAGIELSL